MDFPGRSSTLATAPSAAAVVSAAAVDSGAASLAASVAVAALEASGAASLVVVVPCALLPHAARDTVMHTASAVAKNFFIITLSSSRFYAPYKNKTV